MKLLLYSPAFLPHVGGLELNVAHLADEIARAGHEVVVATTTAGAAEPDLAYRVVRRPSPFALLRWVRWCDVFFQANVSLKGLWPLLLLQRPWVVSHHSWYCRTDGHIAWQDRLKRRLVRHAAASIAVSQALADDLGPPTMVIPNCYRDRLFRRLAGTERRGELLFVGRLVSDKGVDVLLDALAILATRGLRPALTLVGEGPERAPLEDQARRLALRSQVTFHGLAQGEALVRLMNEHRVLVVPSRYHEPFGIVALEGIACGCVVVGSAGGGLPEAIGPGGRTFPNGDAGALAAVLAELLAGDDATLAGYRERAEPHLRDHASAAITARYLDALAVAWRPRRAAAATQSASAS
jgi:glycosyltransferase involved in cell wall biosynthesis